MKGALYFSRNDPQKAALNNYQPMGGAAEQTERLIVSSEKLFNPTRKAEWNSTQIIDKQPETANASSRVSGLANSICKRLMIGALHNKNQTFLAANFKANFFSRLQAEPFRAQFRAFGHQTSGLAASTSHLNAFPPRRLL